MGSESLKKRINSIDAMRGLVILLMLLDHVRERFFLHEQISDPMLIDATSEGLFWSRFAAHFCAPVFVFLTGMSAWLYQQSRDQSTSAVRSFLWRRGLFLVVLEIAVINFAWMGNYDTLYLQVIWAIGISMLALACCVGWPRWLLLLVGLTIVCGHNALEAINFAPGDWGYLVWTVLHDRGYLLQSEAFSIRASYPVLPWIGVILLGYVAGPLYAPSRQARNRYKWLLALALLLVVSFIALRGLNLYGETQAWFYYDSVGDTLRSFMNLTKYPPSLNFLQLTLAGMFVGLYLFERYQSRLNEVLAVYGGAPMFFYIFHLYVLLLLYRVAVAIWGTNQGIYFGVDSIDYIWLISAVLAALLYLPTRYFNAYKRGSTQAWLRYF